MIEERLVRVVFRKQVSDGNYGSESVEVGLERHVDDDKAMDLDSGIAAELLSEARRLAEHELMQSPSVAVRRVFHPRLSPTAMQVPDFDDEDPF